MKILMIMLSGVMLVNSQDMGKERFESITHTKVVEQYKIIPNEVVQQAVAKKATTSVKKATPTKKKTTKKKEVKKTKKKVIKKKTTKKKTYKQTTRISYNRSEIQSYAYSLVKSYGWSDYDWECLVKLWNRESSWNPNAVNKKSGACGLGQAYPCSKATKGTDYRTNWRTQVRWGLNYIKKRYGNPSEAWKHSQDIGWY